MLLRPKRVRVAFTVFVMAALNIACSGSSVGREQSDAGMGVVNTVTAPAADRSVDGNEAPGSLEGTSNKSEVAIRPPGNSAGLPLDASFDALEEFQVRLDNAQGRAVEACAIASGITGYVPLDLPIPSPRVGFGQFGLEDGAIAARSGYYVELDASEFVADPARDLTDQEASVLMNALFGSETEDYIIVDADGREISRLTIGKGCLYEFYQDFFGDLDRYVRFLELRLLLENARIDAHSRLVADPAYHELIADWEKCMRNAGTTVDVGWGGPSVLTYGPVYGDAEAIGWPEPRPSDTEIRTAVADTECKLSTSFVPVATELLSSHQAAIARQASVAELDAELRQIYREAGVSRSPLLGL